MRITNPTRSEPCATVQPPKGKRQKCLGLHAVCSMQSAFDQSVVLLRLGSMYAALFYFHVLGIDLI